MASCHSRRVSWRCAAFLTLVACGGADDGGELRDRSDADRPEPASEAGDDFETEAGDGIDAGSDGGEPGQNAMDDRLQPFEEGRRWSYTRVLLDTSRDGGCEGPLESYVVGTVQRDGRSGWDYRPTCMDSGVQMFIEGDDIWAYVEQSSNRSEYAKGPVQEGFEWPLNAGALTRYGWQDQGSIDVPAGSFERCWRRVQVGATDNFIVLCRGVGLVVTQSVTQNFRLELLEKNF